MYAPHPHLIGLVPLLPSFPLLVPIGRSTFVHPGLKKAELLCAMASGIYQDMTQSIGSNTGCCWWWLAVGCCFAVQDNSTTPCAMQCQFARYAVGKVCLIYQLTLLLVNHYFPTPEH